MRALIIDDEPLACRVLRKLVGSRPDLVVAGEAGTFEQAQTRLAADDYDLVFLDIQLRGGNGFDLVPHVRGAARIVFVTAFDRFALRAFEVNALDYLLKPVTPERFAASLARLTPAAEHSTLNPQLSTPAPLAADDRAFIQTDRGNRFVPLADISAVFSNQNYSDVLLRSGERLFTRRTMKAWEDMLPGAVFARVHRQALVNLGSIEELSRDGRDSAVLRVTGVREPIDVSRRYVADIQARLNARTAR